MEPQLAIHANVDDAAVRQAFSQMLARVENPRAALDDIGEEWVGRTHRRFELGGHPERWKRRRDGSASHLTGRGDLQRSIHHRTTRRGVTIGTRHRGARTHQLGAEGARAIRPRRRRFLSIPLKKGRMYQAGAGAFFRRYPDRVFSVFEDGKGTVFMKRGKKGKPEPIFLLRKKVEIPQRRFLLASREDMEEFARILADWAEGRRR